MPQIPMPYTVHLDHTLRVTPLNTLFSKGDSAAHRFELTILRAGVQEELTGCKVVCKFYRMAESAVVSVDGTIEDGKAVAVLNKACYDYIGRFALNISIKKGEEETTVFYGDGYMHGQNADTAISGEYIIYDINTLLEKIAEIDAATQAANTSTGNANTAASNANTAKDAANAAAAKINAMTVSATPVSTGTATAALSTVDGHYHLALGLPKGDTGATPQISVQVQTGAAGSEAQVSVSGTAENPVIHLTIPRGDVGNIGALTINGKAPDGSGAVTLEMSDIDGLPDAIANAGGVKTVAGVGPDSAGNVALTASDVGALPSGGTAADSSKLGGKSLAQIMLEIYPIGSIYMSVNSTSPASLFGGEWTQINGRFLIGTGAPELNDDGTSPGSYNFSAGRKGGKAEHTLNTNEIPQHYHDSYFLGLSGTVDAPAYYAVFNQSAYTYNYAATTPNTLNVASTGGTGGNQPHNNMPPYLAVYMWKRVS